MTGLDWSPGFDTLVARARALTAAGGRRILGIAGAPGSGKSTLAAAIVGALDGRAVLVGMDGFHLAGTELDRLGRAERKGAPDTFDAAGYVALLDRLRAAGTDTVYAPEFRREIEEPVGSAVPVPPGAPLVVTEGNYLLLDEPPWSAVRRLLDEAWFLTADEPTRRRRLIERHRSYGRTQAQAQQRTDGSDECNARLVAATVSAADLVITGRAQGTWP